MKNKTNIEGRIKKLKLNKKDKYLLLMDKEYFSPESAQRRANDLGDRGYECVIALVDDVNSMRLVDLPNS